MSNHLETPLAVEDQGPPELGEDVGATGATRQPTQIQEVIRVGEQATVTHRM